MAGMLAELDRKLHHEQPRGWPTRRPPMVTVQTVRTSLDYCWSRLGALYIAEGRARWTGRRQRVEQVRVVGVDDRPAWPVAWRVREVGA